MLTRFYSDDTIKMKITVIMIWLIASAISFGVYYLIRENHFPFWMVSTIVVVTAFSMLAILLRCKVGRWFTLLGIYTLMLIPIMISILPIFLLPNQPVVPINLEYALIHLVIGGLIVYFLSNRESMEIFYIKPSVSEHFLFLLLATGLIASYIYVVEILHISYA